MTVKELREFIKDLPDEMPVYSRDGAGRWSEAREGVVAPIEMVDGKMEFRAPSKGTDALILCG